MDPASLGLGVLSAAIQSYNAVVAIYDAYLYFKSFPKEYKEIRMGLFMERYRLELWASVMHLSQPEPGYVPTSRDISIWRLLEVTFNSVLEALQEGQERMEQVGQVARLPTQEDLSDHELLGALSISARENPKVNRHGALRKIRFILRDKKRMNQLVKQLRDWNDSLEKLTTQMEQESLRRKLRTEFTTKQTAEMPDVRDAAAFLGHQDIQNLASARLQVEKARKIESTDDPFDVEESFELDSKGITWKGVPFATDQPRAFADYKGQEVIVDWRASQDDSWRIEHPKDFQKRTENLTMILNQDLKGMDLSLLHCVGYLNQGKNYTGYAFQLPDHARGIQKHYTLFELVSRTRKPAELPDLGDRFELAKALVNTIYEIQSINWMHKNISTRNIIFWPKKSSEEDFDIAHPYLLGFDVSRPNQPAEFSEMPDHRPDDNHYRHPEYRRSTDEQIEEDKQRAHFKLSYDFYSLGVVLYEIGMWRNLSHSPKTHPTKPGIEVINDSSNLIQKCLEEKQLKELRRHTGGRYTNIVVACLNREFDRFWSDSNPLDAAIQLPRYLRHVQNVIVDPLAACCA